MRSGYVDIGIGELSGAANVGYWWSSRTYSNIYAGYNLYFLDNGLNPSDGNYRYSGYPLRCLSTAIDMWKVKRNDNNTQINIQATTLPRILFTSCVAEAYILTMALLAVPILAILAMVGSIGRRVPTLVLQMLTTYSSLLAASAHRTTTTATSAVPSAALVLL